MALPIRVLCTGPKGVEYMKEFKLAVLGGGFFLRSGLIDGIAKRYLNGEFHAREIVMVDVPEGRERMETVASFTRRMLAKQGVPCEIKTTLDRRGGLRRRFLCHKPDTGRRDARETKRRTYPP